jgi:acetyl-CoA carboxylase biotin carboxyl carrier protein
MAQRKARPAKKPIKKGRVRMTAKDEAEKPAAEQQIIRDLAHILNETGLSEIEIEKSGLKIRVARTITVAAALPAAHTVHAPAGGPAPAAAAGAAAGDPAKHPGAVKSPMVGTAYRSPEPTAPAFVDVGSKVQQGETLLIIEAMKTFFFNQTATTDTDTAVLFENGQPVEFGEPLVIIE